MIAAAALPLILGLIAQAPGAAPVDPAARLALMKDAVAAYDVHQADGRGDLLRLRLQPEPIFRMANDITGVEDGAIFFWTDEVGRPTAAVQAFKLPGLPWLHEFTSLATGPFVARLHSAPAWSPARPGVEFRPISDAPKPADSPEGRLRQVRPLARDFAAEDYFNNKAWSHLRLLPRPLARYGKPGATPTDGALFNFALGTDPEAFLMIEARPGPAGPEWYYAFAPMTCYELKGSWKGKVVWTLPARMDARVPEETYFTRAAPPESGGPK